MVSSSFLLKLKGVGKRILVKCLKLNWKKRNNFVLEDEMQHTCDRAGSNLPKLQSCRSCIVYDKFYNKVVDCNLLINGIDFSRHAT